MFLRFVKKAAAVTMPNGLDVTTHTAANDPLTTDRTTEALVTVTDVHGQFLLFPDTFSLPARPDNVQNLTSLQELTNQLADVNQNITQTKQIQHSLNLMTKGILRSMWEATNEDLRETFAIFSGISAGLLVIALVSYNLEFDEMITGLSSMFGVGLGVISTGLGAFIAPRILKHAVERFLPTESNKQIEHSLRILASLPRGERKHQILLYDIELDKNLVELDARSKQLRTGLAVIEEAIKAASSHEVPVTDSVQYSNGLNADQKVMLRRFDASKTPAVLLEVQKEREKIFLDGKISPQTAKHISVYIGKVHERLQSGDNKTPEILFSDNHQLSVLLNAYIDKLLCISDEEGRKGEILAFIDTLNTYHGSAGWE
jgi:hypothetical protein